MTHRVYTSSRDASSLTPGSPALSLPVLSVFLPHVCLYLHIPIHIHTYTTYPYTCTHTHTHPLRASSAAVSRPMPVFAPVTIACRGGSLSHTLGMSCALKGWSIQRSVAQSAVAACAHALTRKSGCTRACVRIHMRAWMFECACERASLHLQVCPCARVLVGASVRVCLYVVSVRLSVYVYRRKPEKSNERREKRCE